uniref:Death domain-containing protein n=2 Tax=Steinernema glaseri TaxID=37863 RepID=A0A1I7YM33_9BILA
MREKHHRMKLIRAVSQRSGADSYYHLDGHLTSESIFYDHFNYVLRTWIDSYPNQVAKEDFHYDLLKLVKSQDSAEDKNCSYNFLSGMVFLKKTLNNTIASIEANNTLDEIWEDLEGHLRLLGYQRSSVIQHFLADFVEYNKDKTSDKLRKLVEPIEDNVKNLIKQTVPRRLKERAEVFWGEFIRSNTPGIIEKCMRFLPDSSIVEWNTVIEAYKSGFIEMKTACVPTGHKMEHPQFKFFVIMGILAFCLACVCVCKERRRKWDNDGLKKELS